MILQMLIQKLKEIHTFLNFSLQSTKLYPTLKTMKTYYITEAQYNYLLPVPSVKAKMKRISQKGKDVFIFTGTEGDYRDMLERCKYLD